MLRLPPNEAHRWWNCFASLQNHATDLPVRNREAADMGVAAAKVAEIVLTTNATTNDMIGWQHPNGVECDADMARHVQTYVEIIDKWDRVTIETERKLVWQGYDTIIEGRVDALGWTPGCRRIGELKYGFDPVEVFENKQLICYAVADYFALTEDERAGTRTYCLAIIQPRAQHPEGPYRRWTISVEELMTIWLSKLNNVVAGLATDMTVQTPGSHCKRCKKAGTCEALTTSVYALSDQITGRRYLEPTGQQLSDEWVMLELWSDLLKARKTAVEAEIEGRLMSSKFVPGCAIEQTIGKSKFKHEDPAVIEMMTGVDPRDTKICTPAELIRRGADKKTVEQITYRPRTGSKLKRVTTHSIGKAMDG